MRLAALIVLLLAGCAAPAPRVEVVRVPVPVPCLDRAPERPTFLTDEAFATLPLGTFVTELWADRRDRQAYEAELEAAVAGCVSAPGR